MIRGSSTSLFLTSDEILARARKAVGLPEIEPVPMVFDDDILPMFQSALLKLETRVKEGPGSLSILEVEELDMEVKAILDEMHQNPHKRLPKPSPSNDSAIDVQASAAPTAPSLPAKPQPSQQQQQQQLEQTQAPVAPQSAPATDAAPVEQTKPAMDISMDEGPVYDGTGGMGQAKGTVNTYIIEGMDEMTSEEYRAALDKTIVDRLRQRREAGVVGSQSSSNYLESLGGDDEP